MNNSIAIRNTTFFCSFPFGGLSMTPWRDVACTLRQPAPLRLSPYLKLPLMRHFHSPASSVQSASYPCNSFLLPWNRTVCT
ncbi:putative Isoflavone reductaseP7 [Fusarium oxysporum f. sp. albedinis]|nr:putative Isoflavone reductaseP7 [Fusarium oxysporum f. sp. albedinis]